LTFPRKLEDSPAHATNSYPGRDGTVRYEEGLLVGYRYFDTKQVEPAFCFGHGLSYTSFEYDQLALNEDRQDGREVLMVQFDLSNVGQCAGAETVQVYVRHHRPRLFRPVKELKGFDKVYLQPGESQRISIPLDRSAFSFYDDAQGGWIFEPGEFSILVGSSSRDIRLQASLQISDSRMRSYGN
jgi:beta-glucosidase